MNHTEYTRLMGYWKAQQTRKALDIGHNHKPSKRSVRHNGSGTGQVLKRSYVSYTVHVGTVFATESTAYHYSAHK